MLFIMMSVPCSLGYLTIVTPSYGAEAGDCSVLDFNYHHWSLGASDEVASNAARFR